MWFPTAEPGAVGLPADTAQRFADALHRWVDRGWVVGAELLVVKDRQSVAHEQAGWADREGRLAVAPNTIFEIRSMTKPFVGTAAMMLADEGRLSWSDPVSRYLPTFDRPGSRWVTIELLLRHCGGFDQPGFLRPLDQYRSLREAVDELGEAGPSATPDSRFCYSDAGSAVLGAVVEQVADMPLGEWIASRILEPLGLEDTSCHLPEHRRDRLSSAYVQRDARFVKYWDRTQAPPLPFFRACGGMYSTVTDYARFLSLWMDGGRLGATSLLHAATVARALRPTPGSRGWLGCAGYGAHWVLYSLPDPRDERVLLVFGHEGSDGLLALAAPSFDLMVLYFTQSREGDTVLRLMQLVSELTARCDRPR